MKIVDGELHLEAGEHVVVKMPFDTLARISKNVSGGIEIGVTGYSDKTSVMDGQPVIMVEKDFSNKLRVICWADINREDPTTIIDMEDARESKRGVASDKI